MRALVRTQLRIALGTCAVVMTVVTGLPVLLSCAPAIARARVGLRPLPARAVLRVGERFHVPENPLAPQNRPPTA